MLLTSPDAEHSNHRYYLGRITEVTSGGGPQLPRDIVLNVETLDGCCRWEGVSYENFPADEAEVAPMSEGTPVLIWTFSDQVRVFAFNAGTILFDPCEDPPPGLIERTTEFFRSLGRRRSDA